jgi:hypothetical protein
LMVRKSGSRRYRQNILFDFTDSAIRRGDQAGEAGYRWRMN